MEKVESIVCKCVRESITIETKVLLEQVIAIVMVEVVAVVVDVVVVVVEVAATETPGITYVVAFVWSPSAT